MSQEKPFIPPFTIQLSSLKLKRSSSGAADMNVQRNEFVNDETHTLLSSISEWMSAVLNKYINSDLTTTLADGTDLCMLFEKCFPDHPLKNWHKDITKFPIYKRDNIWAFTDGCKSLGIPSSSVLDYTYFENKNEYRLVGCMLMFIKTVFEKNGLELNTESQKHQEAIGRISDIFLNQNPDDIDTSLLSDLSDIDISLDTDIHISTSTPYVPPEVASFSPIKGPNNEDSNVHNIPPLPSSLPPSIPTTSETEVKSTIQNKDIDENKTQSSVMVNQDHVPSTIPPVSFSQEDNEDDVIPITDDDFDINDGAQLSIENGEIPLGLPPSDLTPNQFSSPENEDIPLPPITPDVPTSSDEYTNASASQYELPEGAMANTEDAKIQRMLFVIQKEEEEERRRKEELKLSKDIIELHNRLTPEVPIDIIPEEHHTEHLSPIPSYSGNMPSLNDTDSQQSSKFVSTSVETQEQNSKENQDNDNEVHGCWYSLFSCCRSKPKIVPHN